MSRAVLIGDAESEFLEQLPVELDIPGRAARVSERPEDRVRVGTEVSVSPCGPRVNTRTCRQFGEGGDVQRHAVVEQAASGLEQRPAVASQCKRDPAARSRVSGIGDRIAVEPQPEVDLDPLGGTPLIAGEPGEFILIDRKASRARRTAIRSSA